MNKHTRGAKIRSILILIGMIACIAVWGAYAWQQLRSAPAEEWMIPMANQNVAWSSAGYNGIYGRQAHGQQKQ